MDQARHSRPPPVTFHAVTRYVQRVLNITVPGGFADPMEEAEAHCAAAGLTVDQVRHLIWTPGMMAAVKAGFRNIWTKDFRAFVSDEGAVVTIKPPRSKEFARHRLKILSEREIDSRVAKFQRRVRRHPRTNWKGQDDD